MDPMVAAMMADLGLARREALSTVEDRAQAPGMAEIAALRAENERMKQAACGDERLAKWHDASSFSRDEITENLEDFCGGQSHRAAMRARIGSGGGDRWQTTSRFSHLEHRAGGEERMLYLSERAGENYTHAAPKVARIKWSPDVQDNSDKPRTIRHMNDRYRMNRQQAPPHATNPQRASSPRAAGTVRFVNGQRIERAGTTNVAAQRTSTTQPHDISTEVVNSGRSSPPVTSAIVDPPASQPTFNDKGKGKAKATATDEVRSGRSAGGYAPALPAIEEVSTYAEDTPTVETPKVCNLEKWSTDYMVPGSILDMRSMGINYALTPMDRIEDTLRDHPNIVPYYMFAVEKMTAYINALVDVPDNNYDKKMFLERFPAARPLLEAAETGDFDEAYRSLLCKETKKPKPKPIETEKETASPTTINLGTFKSVDGVKAGCGTIVASLFNAAGGFIKGFKKEVNVPVSITINATMSSDAHGIKALADGISAMAEAMNAAALAGHAKVIVGEDGIYEEEL